MSALTGAVPPGSYLAIMHPASDLDPALLEAERRWNQLAAQRVRLRSREEVTGFLAGLEPVEPGLVAVPEWRPERAPRPGATDPALRRGRQETVTGCTRRPRLASSRYQSSAGAGRGTRGNTDSSLAAEQGGPVC